MSASSPTLPFVVSRRYLTRVSSCYLSDLDSVEDDVSAYYAEKGTKIVQDTNQDTTDLQKCIHLLQSLDTGLEQVDRPPNVQQHLMFSTGLKLHSSTS